MPRPTADIFILFSTRFVRLFAYGALSVMLVLYLIAIGLSGPEIGLLLMLTLVGDTAISLWLTTRADRFGRRRTLMVGAALMVAAGVVFALTHNFFLLLLAATIGVVSPSGNEVGPFLSVEQAALSHVISDRGRTWVFAWYTLAASLATAAGSLAGGLLIDGSEEHAHMTLIHSYRAGIVGYASVGRSSLAIFSRLSPRDRGNPFWSCRDIERSHLGWGLDSSQRIVLKLSALFAPRRFRRRFVIQSMGPTGSMFRFGLFGVGFAGNFFRRQSLGRACPPWPRRN